MPYLQNSSETETIVGIQFGVFSPEEVVRRSVVEITSHVAIEGKIGGLFDPRMGVLENGKLCRSCGLNNHNCPGHFGHYKLARPVYYIQFFKLVMKVLRCICVKCGKLRIDKSRYKHILRLKGEARWKQVLDLCSKITRCGEDIEDGCGARQPSKYKDDDICRIVAEWKDIELPEGMALPSDTTLKDGIIERYLEPEYVYRLLRRISNEDVDFMGFSRFWCRPDWMMCTVLPIPPPQVRPSVLQDNNQRSEDDLTQKLIDIIKTNKNLESKIQTNAKKKAIDEWTNVLQYHIATLIDNEIPGVAPSAQRSGRPLKSLQQRLGSKEGRIRNNLQGKRVEFSARSVITPDPNISVAELGVPLKIAMNLTHPERVTPYNIERLYALIQNGPDRYPGAKTIIRATDGRIISLKHVNAKDIQLYKGDIVNRHIMDGDIVLFNRQPSLHRMSMMGHRAKVLPYNTFRLNVSVTAPYNADFDGDEMNAHIPQSIEAAIELREIAAVPLQIVGPRESKPIVSVVQDTLVGVNRFTRDGVLFNRREAMNLLVWASRWDGVLPEPAVKEPIPMWSGKQLLSTLLPPVNLEMRNISFDESKGDTTDSPNFVKIHNGIIKQGILDKDVFSKALIHVIYNDYGHEVTVDFLDSLQRMMANYLMNSGFSVGISDLIADEDTKGKIDVELSLLKGQIEDILLQVHTGLFDNASGRTNSDEFESKVFATLNKVIDKAGKEGRNSLADDNRMTNMIKAGSKGSNTNVAQMIAVLGQQNIEGKRIPYGFQDRTLPHFKRFDDGAAARGFIESSFVKGLTPHEFFFHAMSGREGLIDTAVKTADTGYMQRQLVKAMEDLTIQHDGSVRDAAGNIVQFAYGEDGINCTKIESQPLNLAAMTDEQIQKEFAIAGVSPQVQAAQIKAILEDRKMLVERIFLRKLEKADKQNVYYPVHLDRLVHTLARQFEFTGKEQVADGAYILDAQQRILTKTFSKNRLWAALLRYHLAPHKLQKLRYTKAAVDALAEHCVLKHWQAMANPGEMVGIIAAQSIGEPSTQMTLNSVDWDTRIMIAKNGEIQSPQIGEFIDDYLETCDPAKIQHLPNDQKYVPLDDGNDWQALSCDKAGKMQWTKLEAVTKHPVINEDGTNTILEVTLESGRTVKATKGLSFLTLIDGKIMPIKGSDLKIGTIIPISNSLSVEQLKTVNTFNIRPLLPATEWIYGTDVEKAKEFANGTDRHWFQKNQGVQFTIPYSRSDAFREAMMDGRNSNCVNIKPGYVYPKRTRPDISQIPEVIPLTTEFGFFVGAYLAEGMSNTTQISITNNDEKFMNRVKAFMDSWNVGTHSTCEQKHCPKTNIKGLSTSLIIHSTLLAKVMQKTFGRVSHEKTLPDWVFQANDDFVAGLVDGYISGDGWISKKAGTVMALSVSKDLIVRFQALLSRYSIFSTIGTKTPKLGKFQSVSEHYTMTILSKYSQLFAQKFTLTSVHKQKELNKHLNDVENKKERNCYRESMEDVIWDKVKNITETPPLKGGKVYDVTVEHTRNFVTLNGINQNDTFHLAGVAAKSNVTRGVPRLKELLKATRNPKAVSLTIYLRKDLRASKDEARRVAQELEFTVLQDLTNVARIYFDPRDDETLISDDAEWLSFYAGYEKAKQDQGVQVPPASNSHKPVDATAAEGHALTSQDQLQQQEKRSPWILRLELDREKMFSKNITMDDIAFVLNQKFDTEVSTVYSDYNSTRLVFRLRLNADDADPLNSLNQLKMLQNKILMGTIVRGVPGLRSVSFNKTSDQYELLNDKYAAVDQFVLDTDGSNMLDVMCHPDVDALRVISNNVHDIFENLGIEATRAILFKEISTLFEETYVNYRHLCLLCDVMAARGRLMSVDRYGINKNNIGPLAKASFEQTEDIMLRAALYGELDPITGVSANIMTGQPIRGGTSFSQILLDEEALIKYTTEAPEDKRFDPQTQQGMPTDEQLDNILYKNEGGYCSTGNLHLESALPPIQEGLAAEELPEATVELVDE